MADEIQNLILNVVNQDKLEQLNKQLKVESDQFKQLAADLRTGAINTQQFETASVAAATKIAGLDGKCSSSRAPRRGSLRRKVSSISVTYSTIWPTRAATGIASSRRSATTSPDWSRRSAWAARGSRAPSVSLGRR